MEVASSMLANLQAWASNNVLLAAVSAVSILGIAYFASPVSRANPRSPPWVPYWIPWVGSALTLGHDPDSFFKKASDELGPIFRVKAMGRNMTYVTSPTLIAAIYRDSKTFEFSTIRSNISQDVFNLPKEVCHSEDLVQVYYPAHHRVLSPKGISGILARYAQHTFEELSSQVKVFEGGSGPLTTLVIMPAYVAASNAFWGDKFPAEETYGDFAKFNDAFHILVAKLPRVVTAGARESWERVTDAFETYIKDIRKIGGYTEMIEATLEMGTRAGWNDRVLAGMLASDMWAMQANAIWAAYWFLVFLLQRPSDYKRVAAEVDAARSKWTAAHPDTPLTSSNFGQFMVETADYYPLISSGIQETLRLRTSSFSIRRVTTPTEFGGFVFNVNDELICNTRSIHMDPEVHEKPYDFILDRYTDSSKKYTKNGVAISNHSLPFGGGVSMCEGRHFAQAEIKTFIVALLNLASVEPDMGSAQWPTPAMDRVGVGIISPKTDVDVIVRKHVFYSAFTKP